MVNFYIFLCMSIYLMMLYVGNTFDLVSKLKKPVCSIHKNILCARKPVFQISIILCCFWGYYFRYATQNLPASYGLRSLRLVNT